MYLRVSGNTVQVTHVNIPPRQVLPTVLSVKKLSAICISSVAEKLGILIVTYDLVRSHSLQSLIKVIGLERQGYHSRNTCDDSETGNFAGELLSPEIRT
ncbi:hypothetical protein J6590_005067 [Homalodisca vitripennis]|nr:hypothetical protein J6590_005067 [Homalodisca vitripennis]